VWASPINAAEDLSMIRRREFSAGIGGAVAAWPLAGRAQPNARLLRRVGALMALSETDPEGNAQLSAFTHGLADLGWIDGRTVRIDVRWAAGSIDRARMYAKELVDLQPDVIFADSTPEAAALHRENRAEALYIANSAFMAANRTRLTTFALGLRLATICASRDWPEAGALMSFGANFPDMFRHSAEIVDKILRGARPADIPIEQPTKFELVVNRIVAKALGLTIPESFLLRADEVIE
jgi:ABC-type uncharacterized transport system substrate-binding protein